MSFKLKNKYEMFGYNKDYSNGDRLVVEKKLPKDVYGQINPNGVIEINQDISSKEDLCYHSLNKKTGVCIDKTISVLLFKIIINI